MEVFLSCRVASQNHAWQHQTPGSKQCEMLRLGDVYIYMWRLREG